MFEILSFLFVLFVLLGLGLIDSRLNKLVKIQRQLLIDTREVADHLAFLRRCWEAQIESRQ